MACFTPVDKNDCFSNVYIRDVVRSEIQKVTECLKGDSAYSVAVNNGYVGTEDEWLASLGSTITDIKAVSLEAGSAPSANLAGAPRNRVINLGIPKGEKGEEGEKGVQGVSGLTGLSAYDIAVANGFDGTKTDWLLTIKGAKGDNGPEGPKGEEGKSTYDLSVDYGFIGSEREWLTGIVNDTELMSNLNEDLLSIDVAVNGDENTQVVTRTGETYPSVKKAISDGIVSLFENGGLPATPQPTKAAMEGSDLVDGDYAYVTDDTVNNGLYVKTAGAWVESAYDPLTVSKLYSDEKLDESKFYSDNIKSAAVAESLANTRSLMEDKLSQNPTDEDLLQFSDAEGSIYARFNSDAELVLSDVDNTSVQSALRNIPKTKETVEGDIFSVEDVGQNVVMRLASDGGLYVPDLHGSVQQALQVASPAINNVRRTDNRLRFTDEVNKYVMNLVAAQNGFAPVPYTLMPTNYTITKEIIDALKIPNVGIEVPMDSPYYKDDEFVHPNIIECVGSFRGYRYILMINPFSAEIYENPVIYGSNDLSSFEMLDGFSQPLDVPQDGGYLSDSFFTYDPVNGELIACWRSTRYDTDGEYVTGHWLSRTKDLINWTPKLNYIAETRADVDMIRSASLLYNLNDGLWYMFSSPDRGSFEVRIAKELTGEWSTPIPIPVGAANPWHLEVKYVGGQFVALFDYIELGNYYLGISNDGITWQIASTPMFSESIPKIYKGSFLPNFTADGKLFFEVFYTRNDKSIHRRLTHTQTNSVVL